MLSILALIGIMLIGGYFRFVGLTWGDYSYPHPDERFLIWVVSDIAPVQGLGDYFNTATSTLNPANRGHSFYVYGDLPVVITRYATEWIFKQVGWQEILQTGRGLSALLDLLTVLVVFQTVDRLAGWKAGALAGLLSAAAVLQIQQSHFFTSDTFSTFFTTLTIYIGVLLVTEPDDVGPSDILILCGLFGLSVGLAMACKINTAPVAVLLPAGLLIRWLRLPAAERSAAWMRLVLFAIISGAVAALVFRLGQPYAFSGPSFFNVSIDQRWLASIKELQTQSAGDVDFPPALQWASRNHLFSLQNLVTWGLGIPLGITVWVGFVLFIVRVFERLRQFWKNRRSLETVGQPMNAAEPAGVGSPSVAGSAPAGAGLAAGAAKAAGAALPAGEGGSAQVYPARVASETDLPQAGLSMSFEAGAGSLNGRPADEASQNKMLRIWRRLLNALVPALFEGPWPGLLLIWLWTAFYFTWQSMAWNPTMRYQLPIYPTLVMLGAWGLNNLWEQPGFSSLGLRARRPQAWRVGVGAAGALVVLLTLAWAFAFTRIYTVTESRVAASRWILDNVPGPVNLEGQTDSGKPWKQLVGISERADIRGGAPYTVIFDNEQAGALASVSLQNVRVSFLNGANPNNLQLRAQLFDAAHNQLIGQAEAAMPASGTLDKLDLPTQGMARLESGKRYMLALSVVLPNGEPPASGSIAIAVLNGPVTLNLYGQADTIAYQNGLVNVSLPQGGTLRQLRFPEAVVQTAAAPVSATVMLKNPLTGDQQIGTGMIQPGSPDPVMLMNPELTVKPGIAYLMTVVPTVPLDQGQNIQVDFLDNLVSQSLPDALALARADNPLYLTFTARQSGMVTKVVLDHVAQEVASIGTTGLDLGLFANGDMANPVARIHQEVDLTPGKDPRGNRVTFTLDKPYSLTENTTYAISVSPSRGAVAVRGTAVANESTWDMGLPFRLDNYDPFGGIYRGDLNFEMYWDDNADKLQRFLNTLDQTDYVFMSSNRQWGTTTRVPERYPLTTEFYRRLLGCPADKDVVWCYRVAEPGMFHGDLGFDLVQVDTSYPHLGPIQINDQFAEEAFTVYDHAKVMIFKKRADYSPAKVQEILGAVDLNMVVHVSPKKAAAWKSLLLPPARLLAQQAGGTWARLFPPEGLLNRYSWLALIVWYLFLLLLGLLIYPLLRLALPGLPDRGYPLARIAGLVLLAYLAWIAGSLGVSVTRGLLAAIFVLLALAGIWSAFFQRKALRLEWRERRKYFLSVEAVALVLFTIDLLIRLGNPDLWHPIYGGEKPMDFSFFNAVLKSSVFPPYDPWFAGGYINYYYYGFVLIGMPVKLLGIDPTVAYNLILPALFSLVGLAAFSTGWNLYLARKSAATRVADEPALPDEQALGDNKSLGDKESLGDNQSPGDRVGSVPVGDGQAGGQYAGEGETAALASPGNNPKHAIWAGLVAVAALLILGNLGTVRMYWQGFQLLEVSSEEMNAGTFTQHITWVADGIGKMIKEPGTHFPYYSGDWYWKPSRAIEPEAGNEITEFPFFTFIYADLHAHLIALPVTLFVLAWALAMVLGKGRWGLDDGRGKKLSLGLALVFGALAAGALRPANTWDQYTYLTLAALALAYSQWRAAPEGNLFHSRWLNVLAPVAALVGLAVLLYLPFDTWFVQGYNSLEVWQGPKTSINSYLTHWGLFLFVIVAWLFDETVDWMARTPLRLLNRLRDYRGSFYGAAAFLVVLLVILLIKGIWIALIIVPLGAWVTILILRPDQPEAKRFVLFMIGTALALTLAVELVAVKGDIGRMNTVFKFYYQAWSLLALSAAAGLAWLWGKFSGWHPTWGAVWMLGLVLLVIGAALYPLTATQAKINDRMTPEAAHTLDGMAYMLASHYTDGQTPATSLDMDLSQDYRAIRWVQANIPGSPVIVEANAPEYRHWGTRFTIYTGLPGVVGWNWHERQQRTVTPDTWVYDRIDDIAAFYQTTDPAQAKAFLEKYHVQYIIFGQMEKAWYPGPGLNKFEQLNGQVWERIYQEGQTAIYKVR